MVDVGALIFGAILLLVGATTSSSTRSGSTFPSSTGTQIWPIALIGLGLAVLARAIASRSGSDKA